MNVDELIAELQKLPEDVRKSQALIAYDDLYASVEKVSVEDNGAGVFIEAVGAI